MRIDESYADYITDATRKEFANFAQWFNRIIGHEPLIVGGWAVFAYAPEGRGSKDIDVIFHSEEARDVALRQYFAANGYESRKLELFGGIKFVKTLKASGGREVEIDVDATISGTDITDPATKIRLSWGLAEKHSRRHEIEKGVFIRIPEPELLLAYKLGALIKRQKAMETGINTSYYLTKIIKDVHDIVRLFANCELDYKRLRSFLAILKITPYLDFGEELVTRYAGDADVTALLGKFTGKYGKMKRAV